MRFWVISLRRRSRKMLHGQERLSGRHQNHSSILWTFLDACALIIHFLYIFLYFYVVHSSGRLSFLYDYGLSRYPLRFCVMKTYTRRKKGTLFGLASKGLDSLHLLHEVSNIEMRLINFVYEIYSKHQNIYNLFSITAIPKSQE